MSGAAGYLAFEDIEAVQHAARNGSAAPPPKAGLRNRHSHSAKPAAQTIVMTAAVRELEENNLEENFLLLNDGAADTPKLHPSAAGNREAGCTSLITDCLPSSATTAVAGGRPRSSTMPAVGGPGDEIRLGRSRAVSTHVVGEKKKESKWEAVGDAAFSVACGILDALPNSLTKSLVKELTMHDLLILENFQEKMLVPYDRGNAEHVDLLRRFWDACMVASHRYRGGSALIIDGLTPALPPMPSTIKSEVWKTYGFQNEDPASDFRGGGVFSLQNLLYFAETYPTSFGEFATCEYPFAIAGINVTMMLLNLMRLTHGKATCLATTQRNENFSSQCSRVNLSRLLAHEGDDLRSMEAVFGEVYATCIYLMHEGWLASKRNLLEFNSILNATKTKIDAILRHATRLSDITKHAKLVQ